MQLDSVLNFNTSHVLIYLALSPFCFFIIYISIHLMFLFIKVLTLFLILVLDFNTSHVLIYHNFPWRKLERYSYFNTSHVLIYRKPKVENKYNLTNFNTSHVLIYPFSQFNIVPLLQQFQYISCSYLSITYLHQSVRKPEFQYISCSYLSRGSNGLVGFAGISIHLMFLFIQGFKWAGWLRRHFNTSHVLIYPLVLGCVGIILANFNTSHVLIYRIFF